MTPVKGASHTQIILFLALISSAVFPVINVFPIPVGASKRMQPYFEII